MQRRVLGRAKIKVCLCALCSISDTYLMHQTKLLTPGLVLSILKYNLVEEKFIHGK